MRMRNELTADVYFNCRGCEAECVVIFDWLNLPECELSECDECGVINLVPLSCM